MTSLASAVVPETVLSVLRGKENVALTGLPGGSKSYFLAGLFEELKTSIVLVTSEDLEAEGLSADLDAWVALLPSTERPARKACSLWVTYFL